MPFNALLFDMDGVLVDSEPLHEAAARQVLQAHDLPEPEGLFDDFRGQPDRVLFADRVEATGRTDLDVPALVRQKEAVYAEHAGSVEPLPGVVDLLQALRRRSLPLACVTSATRADQQAVFDACGFDPYFDAVVTADDVTDPKPAPEPYRRGAEQLNMDPAACCVIEDAPHGLRAGQAAGCTVVGVPTSFAASVLEAAGAALVTADMDVLRAWLEERLAPDPREDR